MHHLLWKKIDVNEQSWCRMKPNHTVWYFFVYYHHLPDGRWACIHTNTQMHTHERWYTHYALIHTFLFLTLYQDHTLAVHSLHLFLTLILTPSTWSKICCFVGSFLFLSVWILLFGGENKSEMCNGYRNWLDWYRYRDSEYIIRELFHHITDQGSCRLVVILQWTGLIF